MSSTGSTVAGSARTLARARRKPLAAEAISDWAAARARWVRLASGGTALAFQQAPWLDAWYRHCIGKAAPLIIFVTDETGRDVLGLPLLRLREGVKRVIAFADRGLTDYNAPALARDDVAFLQDGAELWSTLRSALPPADLLRLEKMPATVAGRPNPLALLPGAAPSTQIGNILHVPGTWDDWHWGLERTFRKELERSGRVFEKHPNAAFRRYTAGTDAERIYRELTRLQAARVAELGLPYVLDDEPARSFYETVVRNGLTDGSAVLTALTIGDEVVAALLGITDGQHYAMTRLATPDARYKNFSPGRMVIERTMKMLHADGYRSFDFTIGDYSYKRRIGVTPVPMVDAVIPLSPLGWSEVAKARAKAVIRQNPAVLTFVRHLRGKKPPVETH